MMKTITFYYRKADNSDGLVSQHLEEISHEAGFTLIDICLDDNPELSDRLEEETSALQIGPYRLHFPFDDRDILIALSAFKERLDAKQDDSQEEVQSQTRTVKITGMEHFSYWLSNNYVWFLSIILAIFIGLPILAPVLLKNNHRTSAQVIYNVYSVFCHQLSYRSYFFFGEQAYYPRELAHIPNVITYEEATGKSALDTPSARAFEGNELLGYKVGLCERDLAIYGSLLLAGIFFQLSGRRLKSIPWYLWVIIAILPIGLDGGSQLFSLGGNWPAWLPIRESTPLLRTITGALFGLVTAWYVYPMMEESMKEVRVNLARKITIKKKLIQKDKSYETHS